MSESGRTKPNDDLPSSSATTGSSTPSDSSSSQPSNEGDVVQSEATSKPPPSPPKHLLATQHSNDLQGHAGASSHSPSSFDRQKLEAMLANAIPAMRENIRVLKLGVEDGSMLAECCRALRSIVRTIQSSWETLPTICCEFYWGVCKVLRTDGGLDLLLRNCDVDVDVPRDLRLGSAQVLAESLTASNRDYVVCGGGHEVVVRLATRARDDPALSLAVTGILASLFKHSQSTCATMIRRGGLDAVLYSLSLIHI